MRQVVFIRDGVGGYVVEVPSLPGCRAQGKNISQAIINVKTAIYAYIDKLTEAGQPVPESTIIDIPKADGVIQDQLLLREDVIQAAQEVLAAEDLSTVLEIVDEYGKQPHETDRERVQIAIVGLSEGNLEQLLKLVTAAKRDYRDIIAAYGKKFGKYP